MRSALADPRFSRWLAPLEPWLHASHRYLLPASGAAGLALGGAIVLGSGSPVEPYAGVALVAGGTTALVASFAHRRALARAQSVAASRPARNPPTTRLPTRSPPSARDARLPAGTSSHSSVEGESGWPTRSLLPVLVSSSKPSDQIWSAWVPAGLEALGTELVGPVPETAYVPRADDLLDPYRERAPTLVVDLPEDLEEPPDGPPAPMAFIVPEMHSGPETNVLTAVAREALTALPPHLRTSPPPSPRPPAAPRPSLPFGAISPPSGPEAPLTVDVDDLGQTSVDRGVPLAPPSTSFTSPTAARATSAPPSPPAPGPFGPGPDGWRPHPIGRPVLHHACPCHAGVERMGRGTAAVRPASTTIAV